MALNRRGPAYELNLAHGRRDASRRWSTQCYPLPTGWDWAAKVLDFKAPGPFIRGVPGGEPVAIPTIAQTRARDIAFPTPGNNKEVRKAIIYRTTLDTTKEAQQTLTKGSKGLSQMDVNCDPKNKRADFRLLGWPASPSPSFSGLPAEGALQLTSVISKGDPHQKVPPREEMGTTVPTSSSPRGGASKGSFVKAFRADQ